MDIPVTNEELKDIRGRMKTMFDGMDCQVVSCFKEVEDGKYKTHYQIKIKPVNLHNHDSAFMLTLAKAMRVLDPTFDVFVDGITRSYGVIKRFAEKSFSTLGSLRRIISLVFLRLLSLWETSS